MLGSGDEIIQVLSGYLALDFSLKDSEFHTNASVTV